MRRHFTLAIIVIPILLVISLQNGSALILANPGRQNANYLYYNFNRPYHSNSYFYQCYQPYCNYYHLYPTHTFRLRPVYGPWRGRVYY